MIAKIVFATVLLASSVVPAWAQGLSTTTAKCAYNASPPTVQSGKTVALQCNENGELKTTGTSGGGGGGGDASAANQTSQITQETATATGVGAPADSAWSSGSGSIIAVLKGIYGKLNAALSVTQSGTWTVQPGNTANTTAWKVDGSAVTQPVSAASLPLPSGAATAAKQPALGTAGSASTDVITVQGIASGTAQPISAASLPLPSGAATASNQTTWQSATGSAPPANSVYLGANGSGATGGQLRGLITCDSHQKYDASDNGSKTLVTGVSGRKVYVCGYILATGGTATNLKLREGSDADCATNGADLTPAYQLVANDRVGMQAPFWTGLTVSTNAYYVCVNASAGNAHQAEIWYTIL